MTIKQKPRFLGAFADWKIPPVLIFKVYSTIQKKSTFYSQFLFVNIKASKIKTFYSRFKTDVLFTNHINS